MRPTLCCAVLGTTTLSRNALRRCGCLDMNWKFGVGAMWFYALDKARAHSIAQPRRSPRAMLLDMRCDGQAMGGAIAVSDTTIDDSPYEALQTIGSTVDGLSFANVSVTNAGTFVLQLQAGGSGSFTDVKASGVGFAPIYTCGTKFAITAGAGDASWLTPCTDTADCAAGLTCDSSNKVCAKCGFPPKESAAPQ